MLFRTEPIVPECFGAENPQMADAMLEGGVNGLKEVAVALKELQRVVLLRDAHSLPLIFELVTRLDAMAAASLDDLWLWCINARTDISVNYLSARAKQLCFALLDVCSTGVWQLDIGDSTPGDGAPDAFAESAMRTARWCAKWSWLRYEQPPAHLWVSAANFHECAARRETRRAGHGAAAEAPSLLAVERDYLAMLVLDRLCPNSLSLPALSLLDSALDDCLDGVRLAKEAGKAPGGLLNPVSGRLEIDDGKDRPPAGGRCRFVPLGDVLERLKALLSQRGEGGTDAQREAVHVVVMCSAVGWDGRRSERGASRNAYE